jgi:hypothetical protein
MWLVGFVTLFLRAILDNLTTTIVMTSLIRKLLAKHDDRLFLPASSSLPQTPAKQNSTAFERKLMFFLGLSILVSVSVSVSESNDSKYLFWV